MVFLRFPILLTDDCMCNFISSILIDSLAIKNPCLRLIKTIKTIKTRVNWSNYCNQGEAMWKLECDYKLLCT